MQDPDEILKRIKEYSALALRRIPPSEYRPPEPEHFRSGTVLCFDQTLTNCGWAILTTVHGYPEVSFCGVIRPPAFQKGERGFEATFVKSVWIARGVRDLLEDCAGGYEDVAIELPSVAGYRTESSLVAAVTIVQALDERNQPLPALIPRQRANALLAGDRLASKSVVKSVVNDLIGDHRPKGAPWNEHVHDAVFAGLMHLYRRPE